ncbi:hypothetical protein KQI63_09935 [bacterium]|nr:hypothetical protein [bacterium]
MKKTWVLIVGLLLLLSTVQTQAMDFSGSMTYPYGRAESDDVDSNDYPGTVEQHLDGTSATFPVGGYTLLRFTIHISGGGEWSNLQIVETNGGTADYSYTYPSKVVFTYYELEAYWYNGGSGTGDYSITW